MTLNSKQSSRTAIILLLSILLLLSLWRLVGWTARFAHESLQRAEIWISNSLLSALVLAVLFATMVAWQLLQPGPLRLGMRRSGTRRVDARGEFLYWQVVALIVLLAAPLTWVMNLVWLLPLIVVVLTGFTRPGAGRTKPALVLAAAALVVLALPDGRGAPWMTPALANLIRDKYVVGEGLLLLSLLGYLPRLRTDAAQSAASPG